MTITSINGANALAGQIGMNQAADSYSQNIRNQISNAQKQLQELSSREDLTPEEKMKKRQEIQRQISDLNIQLRQHQAEQRREQQTKRSSPDNAADRTGKSEKTKSGNKGQGLSQAGMTAMISADNSIKQANTQGSVANRMEGKAGVLEAEIKLDASRGISAERKEAELADTRQKAQAAAEAQISTLADANASMKEAARTDRQTQETDTKKENAKKSDTANNDTEKNVSETNTHKKNEPYPSVDVRL